MANENNVFSTFGVLASESEKLKLLEEKYDKLTNQRNLLFEENIKLSSEIDQVDQALAVAELDRDALEKELHAKRTEEKQLTDANKCNEKYIKNMKISFNDAAFTKNMKEYLECVESIVQDYEKEKIQSDIEEEIFKSQLLDEEIMSRTEYLNSLRAEYVPEETLQLGETIKVLEEQLKHNEDWETKLEILEKDLNDVEKEN